MIVVVSGTDSLTGRRKTQINAKLCTNMIQLHKLEIHNLNVETATQTTQINAKLDTDMTKLKTELQKDLLLYNCITLDPVD